MNEEAWAQATLIYLNSSPYREEDGFRSVTDIFNKIIRPSFPTYDGPLRKNDLQLRESLQLNLDQMVAACLIEPQLSSRISEPHYRITDQGRREAVAYQQLDDESPTTKLTTENGEPLLTEDGDFIILKDRAEDPILVDSTNWTGLAKAVGPRQLQNIQDHTKALQIAIMQSDSDIQTKTDACKRVEAVLLLLEAPNVPWREVVGLLNHPSVTAFLAAVSLIQFIIGLAA